jgi:phosphomannomutase
VLDHDIVDTYLAAVGDLSDGAPRDLRIVTTALHGVGGPVLSRVLAQAGFTDVHPVTQQVEPDADFPTVSFPNPEEKGAIDLSLALASQVEADIVIANDPDADRCAMAVLDPRVGDSGGWRMLHGDEVGALLGSEVAARAAEAAYGANPLGGDGSPGAGTAGILANSIVSSRLLERIAAGHNLGYATTLTGFKWIARTPGLIFGYEEAIGFCVDPASVRDKDGISAGLIMAQLANRLKAQGRTVIDQLDDIARQHGLFLTDQLSLRFDNLAQIPETMDRLRANPPAALVGSPIVETADLADGYQGLPPTDGMLFRSADDTRVIIRPSGTEPKVKCYLEVIHPVEYDAIFDRVTDARVSARCILDDLTQEIATLLAT